MTLEVADFVLFGQHGDTDEETVAGAARGLLDDFVEGGWITVGADPFDKDARAVMARVDPVEAEFFDFRCLDPQPQVRIFGAFADTDVFVALTWDYRKNVDGAWPEHVAEARSEWKRLFGNLDPHRGKLTDDYISHNAEVV